MTRIPFLRAEKYVVPYDTLIPTSVLEYPATIDANPGERPWVELLPNGCLLIRQGFTWDGPSGPAIDTPGTMRASLAHDCLYLLIEARALPWACRSAADETYRSLLLAGGVWPSRALWHWLAVRSFGGCSISPWRQVLALLGKANP